MYNNSGISQILHVLTVFSIFHSFHSFDVGIFLYSHVRRNSDNKLETFNDTI